MEQCGRCVDEPLGRHEIISFDDLINSAFVNCNGDAHEHMLRTLNRSSSYIMEVGSLQGLDCEA